MRDPETPNPPAGLILCGGAASRMGHKDKASVSLGGETLLNRVAARLRPQCSDIALSANAVTEVMREATMPILPDYKIDAAQEDLLGPLAGLLSGLEWASARGHVELLTVAVDTPFFPFTLVETLRKAQLPKRPCLAATLTQEGSVNLQPTFGLWPVALAAPLKKALQTGVRKVRVFAETHHATNVAFPIEKDGIDPFFNINTPDDLAKAKTLLTSL